MPEKNNNTFTKILIVLVIASLALLAIVYVLNNAQKNSDSSNLNIFNKSEKTSKKFNEMGKMLINDDMETTDNCGILGCALKVYDETNWKTGETYDVLYSKPDMNIEFTIRNFVTCSNDQYIIPPYTEKYTEEQDFLIEIMPYQQNNPCTEKYEKPLFQSIYIVNKDDKTLKIEDYLNNPNLIWHGWLNPNLDYEIIVKNNIEAIPFILSGHGHYGCFFISGENYNYILFDAFELPEDLNTSIRNIDTSALDNIKILE